ncbi:hypothetical protein [Falsihalocynthiibacter sp. CO-5D18]|uniref:hypothetical protein n=1 Tax=Falsihalocynthiibacter sp. CO-5D18 TaxID=3240872 RepID=UPI0035104E7B
MAALKISVVNWDLDDLRSNFNLKLCLAQTLYISTVASMLFFSSATPVLSQNILNPTICLDELQDFEIAFKSPLQFACFEVTLAYCDRKESPIPCLQQAQQFISLRNRELMDLLPAKIPASGFKSRSYTRRLEALGDEATPKKCDRGSDLDIAACSFLQEMNKSLDIYNLVNLTDIRLD